MGVFSLSPIMVGESIIRWGGTVFTTDQIVAGAAEPHTVVRISEDFYLGNSRGEGVSLEDYMNHS